MCLGLGQYAAANHACIHEHIAENLGATVLLDLENHHNFAWKEKHTIEGVEREVIVHRKGATPAGAGVLLPSPLISTCDKPSGSGVLLVWICAWKSVRGGKGVSDLRQSRRLREGGTPKARMVLRAIIR